MLSKKKISKFENELIDVLSKLLGDKEVMIKIKRKDSDRNEFVGDGKQAIKYLREKNGF